MLRFLIISRSPLEHCHNDRCRLLPTMCFEEAVGNYIPHTRSLSVAYPAETIMPDQMHDALIGHSPDEVEAAVMRGLERVNAQENVA